MPDIKEDCRTCEYLTWVEDDSEASSNSGWTCDKREVEHFKRFPSRKRLACYELKEE